MKLLFLCTVLVLFYSFACEEKKRYNVPELEAKLTHVCECSTNVDIELTRKRETYRAVENRINEKQVNVDDENPRRALADDSDGKERNMIFGNRRKEDGLSFLRKRITKRGIKSCCTANSCVIRSNQIFEECLNEGCYHEEIFEVC